MTLAPLSLQSTHQKPLGLIVLALAVVDPSQVVHHEQGIGIGVAPHAAPGFEHLSEERLGLSILELVHVEHPQVIHYVQRFRILAARNTA